MELVTVQRAITQAPAQVTALPPRPRNALASFARDVFRPQNRAGRAKLWVRASIAVHRIPAFTARHCGMISPPQPGPRFGRHALGFQRGQELAWRKARRV